ncbi:MAG: YgjV family protein [Clostridia bacterium]|nr:YgjV family protein [Clostridia bacterium]
MFICAQIIGFLAMAANIVSYQFKRKQTVLIFQLIGAALFAVNMLMLGASMGFILNIISMIRAVVYMDRKRIQSITGYVNIGFVALYILSYILVFTVFGKQPTFINLITEMLPLIGMTVMTIGFSKTSAGAIRVSAFINSPCWLIYNIKSFSLGGIACEVLSLVSAISAHLRLNTNIKQEGE